MQCELSDHYNLHENESTESAFDNACYLATCVQQVEAQDRAEALHLMMNTARRYHLNDVLQLSLSKFLLLSMLKGIVHNGRSEQRSASYVSVATWHYFWSLRIVQYARRAAHDGSLPMGQSE